MKFSSSFGMAAVQFCLISIIAINLCSCKDISGSGSGREPAQFGQGPGMEKHGPSSSAPFRRQLGSPSSEAGEAKEVEKTGPTITRHGLSRSQARSGVGEPRLLGLGLLALLIAFLFFPIPITGRRRRSMNDFEYAGGSPGVTQDDMETVKRILSNYIVDKISSLNL